MTNEKLKILEMLQEGTITANDAARLLESVGEDKRSEPEKETAPEKPIGKQDAQSKKLRVEICGDSEGEDINVNISVPLMLARFADNIIENCLPEQVNDNLSDKGIRLKNLNLAEIIDTLETLDEDIMNVDVKDDENDMTVRIYVE